MNIFRKIITSNTAESARTLKQLTHRWGGGFETMGAVSHPADTRTAQQISENIEAYAEKIPVVKKFAKELKSLSPKHKALVSDVIERSNSRNMLMTDIRLMDETNGISPFEKLIKDIITASKINPEALSFLQTVLNNTDSLAAKFSLYSMSGGILKNKDVAKQFAAAESVVPNIAKQALSGGYLGTFEKENNFMNFIKIMVHPDSKPKNIELLNDVVKTIEPLENIQSLSMDTLVKTDVPVEKIKDNLSTIPQMDALFKNSAKKLESTDYLLKNTNVY